MALLQVSRVGTAGAGLSEAMTERDNVLFSPLPHSTVAGRLARALGDTVDELRNSPASYVKIALSLENSNNWIVARLLKGIGEAVAMAVLHPIQLLKNSRMSDSATVLALNHSTLSVGQFVDGTFIASAVTQPLLTAKRRRRLRPVLASSAFVHSFLIVYLLYIAIVSPYAGIRVVNKPYTPFDPTMLGPLYYPPGIFKPKVPNETLSLEEIRARAKKRQEELARQREKAEREKEERERAAREKAEKERQIAEAKAAAEKKSADAKPGGAFEFNEAALKDVVGKIYQLYQAGGIDLDLSNFSVTLGFKIEPDGSISNIKPLKSSGSRVVDEKAADVLWTIGESKALGPLSTLTSNSIRLDLNDQIARLTITGFAPTADEAKKKANDLNGLFFMLRMVQKGKNPDVAELLAMARIKSDNKRIDANLTVSRERAAQLMRTKFGNAVP